MSTIEVGFWVVAGLVALAVAFDFMNGFHDAANSIATVVSTGVLKPQQAIVFAAFFNVVAIFIFHLNVAATIGKGIVLPGVVDHHVIFGALIGAIFWNLVTWWYGIPSSSSHALIGGIVGAVIAKAGFGALVLGGVGKTVLFIFVSPLLGFLLGSLLMVAVAHIFRRASPLKVDNLFRRMQLVSAGLYSLGHGGNDAQKTIGIIWMLLIATGYAARRRCVAAGLGDLVLLHGHRARHDVRRLAHRQDDGPEDHEAEAGRRLLRRDGRRVDAVPRDRPGHPGLDDPHDHRRHRRRRGRSARLGGALGRCRQHRLGLDLHDPGGGAGRRAVLRPESLAVRLIGRRRLARRTLQGLVFEEPLRHEGDAGDQRRARRAPAPATAPITLSQRRTSARRPTGRSGRSTASSGVRP